MPSIFKPHNILPDEESIKIPEESLSKHKKQLEIEANIDADCFEEKGDFKEEETSSPQDGGFIPAVMTTTELMEYYKIELDEIRSEAAKKAYADALVKKRGEISECIQKVDNQLVKMQKLQEEYMEKYAYELKYLAIEIAEKMIFQKIEEDELILKKLVIKTVNGIKNASWMNIEVSDRLVTLVDTLKQELERTQQYGRVSVTPSSSPHDTCRINTDEGTVVASISSQGKALREAYKVSE